MRGEPDAEFDEFVAAVAVARLVMPLGVSVQAPPNLAGELGDDATADSAYRDQTLLLRAGIDDWGGVSPITPDHVNPERPWPGLDDLARVTAAAGFTLRPRLTIYPRYVAGQGWIDPAVAPAVAALADDEGLADRDRPGVVRDPVAS
jgi:FO synthase